MGEIKKDEFSDSDIVAELFHFRVDDGFTWELCADALEMNTGVKIPADEVKIKFERYFINRVGIAPYTKCPKCNKGELIPRQSMYGTFIGCSAYPDCNFIATKSKPYKHNG